MSNLQTKLNYVSALLNDINEAFETDLNFYYVCGGDLYAVNSPCFHKKTFFMWNLEETTKYVETLRDMFFNKDHIYEMRSLLDTYNTYNKK